MSRHALTILLLALLLSAGNVSAAEPEKDPLQMADQMRQSGNVQGAVKILRDAEATQPNNPDILRKLGYALVTNGQPEEAVNVFDHWIALKPDSADAYSGKAIAFDHSGNHLAAQELYKQALKLSPDSVGIQNNLAMSMILNGQLDPAIALLEKLNMQADNKIVRQNLALAYGIKGDKEKALALNMKDLPPDQAKENLRFYERYAKQVPQSPSDSVSIGFVDTPEAQKIAVAPPPAPVRAKPVEISRETVKHPEPEVDTEADTDAETDREAKMEAPSAGPDLAPTAGPSDPYASFFGKDAVYNFPNDRR